MTKDTRILAQTALDMLDYPPEPTQELRELLSEGKRTCEFCRDWTPEYLEEYYGVSEMECDACHGTKELDCRDCFCCAYEESECGCDADWGDHYNWENGE